MTINISSAAMADLYGSAEENSIGLLFGTRAAEDTFFITEGFVLDHTRPIFDEKFILNTANIQFYLEIACPNGTKLDLVGWYIIQRNRVARPSIGDHLVHSQIESYLKKPCIFGIHHTQRRNDANRWTITFFYPSKKIPISLQIINLKLSGKQVFATENALSLPPGLFTQNMDLGSVHQWLNANYSQFSNQLLSGLESYFRIQLDKIEFDSSQVSLTESPLNMSDSTFSSHHSSMRSGSSRPLPMVFLGANTTPLNPSSTSSDFSFPTSQSDPVVFEKLLAQNQDQSNMRNPPPSTVPNSEFYHTSISQSEVSNQLSESTAPTAPTAPDYSDL